MKLKAVIFAAALFAVFPAQAADGLKIFENLSVSGYLQAQYVNDESSEDELTGSGTRNRDQFSVRRAYLKFTYKAAPTARFVVQTDIASSSLKDGYVELMEPWTKWKNSLIAGQFTYPFGWEVQYSSSRRELPEYSRVIRTLFPGERDRGVMIGGRAPNERFRYAVAVVNGTGTSQRFDTNERKDLVGRVAYSWPALTVGASAYRGASLVAASYDPTGVEFDKERTGVDFQWKTPLRGFQVRGEYIRGNEPPPAGTARLASADVEGWHVYGVQKIGTRHELAVRVDEYDPDTDVKGNAILTVGGAYLFHWDKNSRIMAAYEVPRHETADPDDNLFTLRYQYSF